jgi:hypothetical protein
VRSLVAVEPEPHLRALAERAAHAAPIPVRVVDGTAESLPLEDGSVDRVLRPGAELRFYEHVRARNARLRRLQRVLDETVWPGTFGGCHTTRDPTAALVASGFAIDRSERFSFRPTLLATPIAPRLLGRAVKNRHSVVGRAPRLK